MRDNLIFKGIHESANEKWKDKTADFIHDHLNLGYSYNVIDSQIGRPHRARDNNNGEKNNGKGPKSIMEKFFIWPFAKNVGKCIL